MELNPDLFPSSQVEWTQVEAYCVSHAENGVKGTDNFRKAFGLKPRYLDYFSNDYGKNVEGNRWQMNFDDVQNVYDFLYYSNDKWGLSYPAVVSTPKYGSTIFLHIFSIFPHTSRQCRKPIEVDTLIGTVSSPAFLRFQHGAIVRRTIE